MSWHSRTMSWPSSGDRRPPEGRRPAAVGRRRPTALAALLLSVVLGGTAAPVAAARPAPNVVPAPVSAWGPAAGGDLEIPVLDSGSATWQYSDTGTDPADGAGDRTVWTRPDFDIDDWSGAKGAFGATRPGVDIGGGNTINTELNYYLDGSAEPVIGGYFFRTTFDMDRATLDAAERLIGTIVYDDAATIYVNGERVVGFGDEMITGNLDYQNRAGRTDPVTSQFAVPLGVLVEGENTMAVEIHQCNDTSSDVFFNLVSLVATDAYFSEPFTPEELDRAYPSDTPPAVPGGGDYFTYLLRGFAELRANHPEVLGANQELPHDQTPVAANDLNVIATNGNASDRQVERALMDGHGSPYDTMADGLGSVVGPLYADALDDGALPKTEALFSRIERDVADHEPAKAAYANLRPYVRLGFVDDGGRIVPRDSAGSYAGLAGNGSFPSGHTNHGYAQGTMLATLLPELAPQILARASEYGDNRIVLAFHYPLDVMGGRMTGQNVTQLRWSDEEFRSLLERARDELRTVLADRCGVVLPVCLQNQTPYLPTDQALQVYRDRLTYGLPRVEVDDRPETVPAGWGDLLLTSFPDLTDHQRDQVLEMTALQSGYPLDTAGADGSWQRIDLAAAMAAEVTIDANGRLIVNGRPAPGSPTTTTMTPSYGSQTYGSATPAMLRAMVRVADGSAPAGRVVFSDRGAELGSVDLDGTATAELPVDSALPVGVHRFTAIYRPAIDSDQLGSTSRPAKFRVLRVTTTTSATVEVTELTELPATRPNTSGAKYGLTVDFAVRANKSTAKADGMIDLEINGIKVGPVTIEDGRGTGRTIAVPAGTADVRARFVPDDPNLVRSGLRPLTVPIPR